MKKISTLIMALLLMSSSLWANTPFVVSQDRIGGIESSITRIKGRSNVASTSVAHDFEDATLNAQWQFAQADGTNKWTFGTAAGSTPSGSNALYISDGTGYSYGYHGYNVSWAYIPVSLTAQDEISYYWKGKGEIYGGADYDYLKVYLFPQGSTPTAGSSSVPSSAIQLGEIHNNISVWTEAVHTPGVTGNYYLCFMWNNDDVGCDYSPAAIDNITIKNKYAVTNLTIDVACGGTGKVYASWESDAPYFYVTAYDSGDNLILKGTVESNKGISNTNALPNGDYVWKVRPMNSSTEGDFAGEEVSQTFTISNFECEPITSCDFEVPVIRARWKAAHANQTNQWTFGTDAGSASAGDYSLYITTGVDSKYNYDHTSASVSWVYIPVSLTAADIISFQWKCVGEGTYDYLWAYLIPMTATQPTAGSTTVPTEAIPLGEKLRDQANWTLASYTPEVTGEYNLFFMWRNDGSYSDGVPAAIDDIKINKKYTLTLTATTGGTVAKDPDQTTYDEDAVVTITATPETGYEFVKWSDENTDATRTITMDQNYELQAIFFAPAAKQHNFEDATLNVQWQFAQTGQTNKWTFGTAAGSTPSGSNALYISYGSGYSYNNNASSTSWAYIPVSLTAQDEISYSWKGKGEIYNGTNYDYLKVYLFPQSSTPTAGSTAVHSDAIQLGEVHNNTTDWTEAVHTPGLTGNYYLCFMWTNDDSYGDETPAAIDNIKINTKYTLTLTATTGGTVAKDPDLTAYDENAEVTITATPETGYEFVKWSDGNTDNPRTITVNANCEYQAVFESTITNYSYNIRVKKDATSAMDLTNGLWIWWWPTGLSGQIATMTLGSDGWYSTTITSTYSTINCLAVNQDVSLDWSGSEQTHDYENITGDICLKIGDFYSYKYDISEVPCSFTPAAKQHDFEDATLNAQWQFAQTGQTNYWTIGTDAGSTPSGNNALYITTDGTDYSYNENASSVSWAYIPVSLTATDIISFVWKGIGEMEYDYLKAYLCPKGNLPTAGEITVPAGSIQIGNEYSNQSGWTLVNYAPELVGDYYLCFMWKNDNSDSYGTPIVIDNINIGETAPCYSLTTTTPTGGTIEKSPAQECYPEGVEVTLTATPNTGYEFVQWSDGNTNVTRTLIMDQNHTIGATFTPIVGVQFTLTLTASTGGTVTKSPDMTLYDANAIVTITATPNTGYEFIQWSDGNTNNPRDITMDNNYEFEAIFHKEFVAANKQHDFEDATINAQWQFAQTGQTNYWTIGTDAGSTPSGDNALYITTDGTDYNYNENASSVSWAYIPVSLTATDIISFVWKGIGEMEYDYLKAYLFPKGNLPTAGEITVPAGSIQLGNEYSDQSAWTLVNHTPELVGDYYLCFMWANDGSDSQGAPIVIDNINIAPAVTQYTLTLTATTGGNVAKNPDQATYDENAVVTITATPETGYVFVKWSDENTNATRTITMDNDYTLQAIFAPTTTPQYTLTLTATTGGNVAKNPDQATYDENAVVTITATPETGYEFVKWSDEVTDATRTITMDQNYELQAIFAPISGTTYTYNIRIKKDASCTMDLTNGMWIWWWVTSTDGQIVEMTLGSDDWYTATITSVSNVINCLAVNTDVSLSWIGCEQTVDFNDITGDICLKVGGLSSKYNLYEVSCSGSGTDPVWYTLNLSSTIGGLINRDPYQDYYLEGSTVTLTATPDAGYEFVKWSDEVTDATRTITMDQNYELEAIFATTATPQYTLTLTATTGGNVAKNPDQATYDENAVVTITAIPETGYEFVKWSDEVTDATRTITMDQNYELEAIFATTATPQYTLTLTATTGGTVAKTPDLVIYDENAVVTIKATPDTDYEFVKWSDGNTNATRIITMDQNYVLEAIFAEKTVVKYTLNLTAGTGGTVTKDPDQANYEEGVVVTIKAVPDVDFEFVTWSDGNTDAQRTITMEKNYNLQAVFRSTLIPTDYYTMTLTSGVGGSVSKDPDQAYYAKDDVVTIKASAEPGYVFDQWSDGSKDGARLIVMDRHYNLHATFKFAESDHDIKDLNVTGSSLRLTAKWTSTATRFEILITDSKDQEVKKEKVDITDDVKVYRYTASKNGTYTVKVTPIDNSNQPVGNGASKSVTLTKTYSLNIYTEGGGTVNEEVNGSYAYGEKVEIIATPNNGYTFKMWSDENTSAKRTLTMDQNYDLMAIFARIPTYTLDIYEGEYGKASMEVGSYTYQKDEQVTLTPIPNEGYKFSHWNVNGEENTSTELVLTMNQDYCVYPVCVEIPVPTYTLTILPNEHGKANMEVGTYTYKEGETVTLLPIANEDYLFSQWLVNGEAKTDSALVIVMDKDYEITPTFVPNQVGVDIIYDGITFRVERNTIIVEATHYIDIALYDLTGHLVDQQSHTRMASFNVPCAGLYLVRTNNGIKKIHVE